MISDSELSELISVPKEWRSGDERILWPRTHDKYNLEWLESLWKYLCEYCKSDLGMMENFNIIYQTPVSSNKSKQTVEPAATAANKNLLLYKLSKNSNLIYTPAFHEASPTADIATTGEVVGTVEATSTATVTCQLNEETYTLLIKILTKLGFQCIDSISHTILNHPLFQNYVPNLRKSRFSLLRAFRNKYKHASLVKITQDFNALLNEADIKLLQTYLSKIEAPAAAKPAPTSTFSSSLQNQKTASNQNSHNKELPDEEQQQLIELLKELPIFENSALECSDRYLPLKEAAFIHDTNIRLPFELPGIKPFIYLQNSDTRHQIKLEISKQK